MNINAEIHFKYNDLNISKTVFNSLEIDNKGFLESEIHNENIDFIIKSDSLGSFLATSDDLIASEIVVEKILNVTQDNK